MRLGGACLLLDVMVVLANMSIRLAPLSKGDER